MAIISGDVRTYTMKKGNHQREPGMTKKKILVLSKNLRMNMTKKGIG